MPDNTDNKNVGVINGPAHLGTGDINIIINQIHSDFSRLLDLVKDNAEANSLISSISLKQASLTTKIHELTGQIGALEKRLDKRSTMKLDSRTKAYIHTDEYGTNALCCPFCWGNNEKIIPLQDIGGSYWHCGLCKTNLDTSDGRNFGPHFKDTGYNFD